MHISQVLVPVAGSEWTWTRHVGLQLLSSFGILSLPCFRSSFSAALKVILMPEYVSLPQHLRHVQFWLDHICVCITTLLLCSTPRARGGLLPAGPGRGIACSCRVRVSSFRSTACSLGARVPSDLPIPGLVVIGGPSGGDVEVVGPCCDSVSCCCCVCCARR